MIKAPSFDYSKFGVFLSILCLTGLVTRKPTAIEKAITVGMGHKHCIVSMIYLFLF